MAIYPARLIAHFCRISPPLRIGSHGKLQEEKEDTSQNNQHKVQCHCLTGYGWYDIDDQRKSCSREFSPSSASPTSYETARRYFRYPFPSCHEQTCQQLPNIKYSIHGEEACTAAMVIRVSQVQAPSSALVKKRSSIKKHNNDMSSSEAASRRYGFPGRSQ